MLPDSLWSFSGQIWRQAERLSGQLFPDESFAGNDLDRDPYRSEDVPRLAAFWFTFCPAGTDTLG